jgi:hypothetical protein
VEAKASFFSIYSGKESFTMKLTKERLVQIIKEEMETIEELQPAGGSGVNFADAPRQPDQQQPGTKMTSDVDRINKLLPRIDNVKEYSELMSLVISPEFPVKGVSDGNKKAILRKMREKINGLLGGGAGEEPAV